MPHSYQVNRRRFLAVVLHHPFSFSGSPSPLGTRRDLTPGDVMAATDPGADNRPVAPATVAPTPDPCYQTNLSRRRCRASLRLGRLSSIYGGGEELQITLPIRLIQPGIWRSSLIICHAALRSFECTNAPAGEGVACGLQWGASEVHLHAGNVRTKDITSQPYYSSVQLRDGGRIHPRQQSGKRDKV